MRYASLRTSLQALALARFPAWAPSVPGMRGIVLTLHRVEPAAAAEFAPNALLSLTPEFLEAAILSLREQGWTFVSVDELLRSSGDRAGPRRLAITLDDGFRDNLDHAWPVFRRHSVPFTIYVCPGFCDRTAEIWWVALERIIARIDNLALDGEADAPATPTRTLKEKRQAFRIWMKWLSQTVDEARQRRVIRALAERHGIDLAGLAQELVMDWDEVRRIAADPLCTIGAHTLTHPALARLSPPEALHEMRGSADQIEAEIGRRPTTLAFPYGGPGAAGPRDARLAAEAGFEASFATGPGYVPAGGSDHRLPRVSVNGHFQDPWLLQVLVTPALWRMRDRVLGRSPSEASDPASPSSRSAPPPE